MMVAVGKKEKKNMRAILKTMEIIKYSKNYLGKKTTKTKKPLSPSLMIMETYLSELFPSHVLVMTFTVDKINWHVRWAGTFWLL